MSTMTISLPEQVANQVARETRKQGFATRSEFIRSLLRRYFVNDVPLQPFIARPLEEIKWELASTGKYSEKFIESVVKGLSKSSVYAR
ncbi:ribbon-helix-helix domain-containing protein [Patescibacteria group bacterium]|nr:ribbon-helix-helix domain-containing protein [Patescibacteria group bacterium]MBU1472380.1 ribbon-helix-helix domain-containing protein [Patescibacteria group bacterium]MBU2459883.1 ribbon-helix-helix domain-containing protein [Patescibacteria group bacterium]MBU2544775.1 ribbon-helix-helix domain-containing protein [Patescibacteria group bacterium]